MRRRGSPVYASGLEEILPANFELIHLREGSALMRLKGHPESLENVIFLTPTQLAWNYRPL